MCHRSSRPEPTQATLPDQRASDDASIHAPLQRNYDRKEAVGEAELSDSGRGREASDRTGERI
jgi:hypothetical protein